MLPKLRQKKAEDLANLEIFHQIIVLMDAIFLYKRNIVSLNLKQAVQQPMQMKEDW